ncbi:MAG TPA: NADH-quinone oxidoreductase subunit C [Acidimicrobiia bacterium]|nr:NADH-quinone oxidoreductase subunit C [Acidimicrobiia bacterium]
MTSSPSETEVSQLQEFADRVAQAIGGEAEVQFGTVKVRIPTGSWVDAHRTARDDLGLVFFSWLSAIDWANEVAVGDRMSEEVEERIELLSALSDVSEGNLIILSTDIPAAEPRIPTLVDVYAGANWHEREAYEMFGIDFEGHPNLIHLYLPDSFLGNPLRKSFPLLSREVKPWPGKVDVEAMPGQGDETDADADAPSTENPEA